MDLAGASPTYDEVKDLALVSVDVCVATMSTTYDIPLDGLEAVFDQHDRDVTAEDQPPFDGVAEVCELVCAGGGVNLIVTHRRRSGMERLLAANALSGLFTDTVTHEDGYPHKPDPAALLMLLRCHDLEHDETLGVGDREIEVLAAHAAGLRAALFAPTPGDLSGDFVLSDFGALSRMITVPAQAGDRAFALDQVPPWVEARLSYQRGDETVRIRPERIDMWVSRVVTGADGCCASAAGQVEGSLMGPWT